MTSPTNKIERGFSGRVVAKSGKQTVSVEVVRAIQHDKYRKAMKRTKKYLAHDPKETVQVGDTVMIRPCRPISKRKHWIVVYAPVVS